GCGGRPNLRAWSSFERSERTDAHGRIRAPRFPAGSMAHARAFPAGSPRLESVFRLLGVLLTVLFAIATAIVTWPQFFRLEQSFPFAQLVAVRGWLVIGFALVLVLALLLSVSRRMRG